MKNRIFFYILLGTVEVLAGIGFFVLYFLQIPFPGGFSYITWAILQWVAFINGFGWLHFSWRLRKQGANESYDQYLDRVLDKPLPKRSEE